LTVARARVTAGGSLPMAHRSAAELDLVTEYEAARRDLLASITAIEELEATPESSKCGLDYEDAFTRYHACRARCKASYLAVEPRIRESLDPIPSRSR
jgi:hypothetical protein